MKYVLLDRCAESCVIYSDLSALCRACERDVGQIRRILEGRGYYSDIGIEIYEADYVKSCRGGGKGNSKLR